MSRRMPGGSRVISTTSFVIRDKSGGVGLEEIVSFDSVHRTWRLIREPSFIELGISEGLIDKEEVGKWRCSLP